MLLMIMNFTIMMLLSNFLMLISLILSKKSFNEWEKISPFECGFNPNSFSRIPFSMSFFLITVIFLIFDIEISLILPIIILFKISNYLYWTLLTSFFIIILILGIYHEWNQNMLNWSN